MCETVGMFVVVAAVCILFGCATADCSDVRSAVVAADITGSVWKVTSNPHYGLSQQTDTFEIKLLKDGRVEVHHGTIRGSWTIKDGIVTVFLTASWPPTGQDVTWFTGTVDSEGRYIRGNARSEVGGPHSWTWEATRIK